MKGCIRFLALVVVLFLVGRSAFSDDQHVMFDTDAHIYVLGEVNHPGAYSCKMEGDGTAPEASIGNTNGLEEGTSSDISKRKTTDQNSQALPRPLMSVLLEAGGVKQDADVRRMKVMSVKGGRTTEAIDLWEKLQLSEVVTVDPGDVVYVPKKGANSDEAIPAVMHSPQVRVLGLVKSPGVYPLGRNEDLVSVIARAGGFASSRPEVLLVRACRDGTPEPWR